MVVNENMEWIEQGEKGACGQPVLNATYVST